MLCIESTTIYMELIPHVHVHSLPAIWLVLCQWTKKISLARNKHVSWGRFHFSL